MASAQTLLLGRYTAPLARGLNRLQAERFVKRLWNKDPSLWSADPTVQASIRERLGWLTIPRVMAHEAQSLQRFGEELRRDGIRQIFLLGMGGSGLFSEVCRDTFVPLAKDGGIEFVVLDTTDPTAIRAAQARCSLEQLLVIVSSKSGSTSEVSALSKYFYDALKAVKGNPGAHCIAITDRGTSLEAQAAAWKFRRAFVHGAETGADVGGRFSALTYFGLVPASLLGIRVDTLLARAVEMLERCGPNASLTDNPALQLGVVLGELASQGKDKLTLLCPPSLASVGTWVEQLVAESTGKSGKGITPIFGEPPREAAAYSTDRVFIELQLATQLDAVLDRRVEALALAGHPVIRIRWQDYYDLGGEVMRWALATAVAGHLMQINPFDEPNVRESKDRTKTLLDQYVQEGRWDMAAPFVSEGALSLYGALETSVAGRSVSQWLSQLFLQRRAQDYVALLSFLPRTQALDARVQELRGRIANALGCATMVGFGPRYLHSTGQLYKGGPDAGLFLLLTADDPLDVPIPEERFTFSVLKQAQALGDFQAMQQRRRRILRVHLRGDLEHAAAQLLSALDDAIGSVVRR